MPLIALVVALAGGQSIGAILAGFTVMQWVALGETILPLGEDALNLFMPAHPALTAWGTTLLKGLGSGAAAKVADSYFANQPPTISGYDGNGAVVAIPNPDYRGK